jgi:hypothetical protein
MDEVESAGTHSRQKLGSDAGQQRAGRAIAPSAVGWACASQASAGCIRAAALTTLTLGARVSRLAVQLQMLHSCM